MMLIVQPEKYPSVEQAYAKILANVFFGSWILDDFKFVLLFCVS